MENKMNKKCCNKKMIELKNCHSLDQTIQSLKTFICGECGLLYEERKIDLDEEDLIIYLEGYEEELKNTKIYRELKREKLEGKN